MARMTDEFGECTFGRSCFLVSLHLDPEQLSSKHAPRESPAVLPATAIDSAGNATRKLLHGDIHFRVSQPDTAIHIEPRDGTSCRGNARDVVACRVVPDLKSREGDPSYGFESRLGYLSCMASWASARVRYVFNRLKTEFVFACRARTSL